MKNVLVFFIVVLTLCSCSKTNEHEEDQFPEWLAARVKEIKNDDALLFKVRVYQCMYKDNAYYSFDNPMYSCFICGPFYDNNGQLVERGDEYTNTFFLDFYENKECKLIWTSPNGRDI